MNYCVCQEIIPDGCSQCLTNAVLSGNEKDMTYYTLNYDLSKPKVEKND